MDFLAVTRTIWVSKTNNHIKSNRIKSKHCGRSFIFTSTPWRLILFFLLYLSDVIGFLRQIPERI